MKTQQYALYFSTLLCAALGLHATVIHQWNFNEDAGTLPVNTVNSGSAATEGAPTWAALTDSAGETNWSTTGNGELRLAGNRTNTGTLVQTVVTMPGLNQETVRFEWDVSWTLDTRPGVIQETFLINRNQDGSNRFRWTLQNPSGTGDPLFRLNVDGGGFAAINNVTTQNDGPALNGFGGNLVLRADFTFGDVGGNNGVTGIQAWYNYDDTGFTSINLGTFTPYEVANLNDLRLHSKGALNETNYIDINSVTVTAIPEPSTLLLLSLGLGLAAACRKWRR